VILALNLCTKIIVETAPNTCTSLYASLSTKEHAKQGIYPPGWTESSRKEHAGSGMQLDAPPSIQDMKQKQKAADALAASRKLYKTPDHIK
jgi:hypothetical protein